MNFDSIVALRIRSHSLSHKRCILLFRCTSQLNDTVNLHYMELDSKLLLGDEDRDGRNGSDREVASRSSTHSSLSPDGLGSPEDYCQQVELYKLKLLETFFHSPLGIHARLHVVCLYIHSAFLLWP